MDPYHDSELELQHRLSQIMLTYFAAIDDKTLHLELYKTIFSKTGVLKRPNGPVKGPPAIFESQHESFKRFRATQHIVTNLLFTKTDDGWKLRGNLQATHLWQPEFQDSHALESFFLANSVLEVTFINEDTEWKIAELGIRLVWRSGSGMNSMAKT